MDQTGFNFTVSKGILRVLANTLNRHQSSDMSRGHQIERASLYDPSVKRFLQSLKNLATPSHHTRGFSFTD
jgi:hypothetical protein